MDYENFKESFIEDLKQGLAERGFEDVKVQVTEVNKLNESYEAITVTPEGSNIGINTNLETFFESYENGMDYDAVVAKAVDTAVKGFDNAPAVDVASLTDYEQMKDKLAMEVVSTDANAELLSRVPHKEIEDMSIVYRFVLESNEDGRASILVTDQLLESMGVSPEQLHADALRTAPELKPVVIKGMSEVMAEMMGMSAEDLAMMGMPTDPADEQMYVATVPDKIHGAGVIAYQNFMDQAAERAGGECLGLRWEDIDFDNRFISVNHNLTDRPVGPERKTERHIQTPKTRAGVRLIPLMDEVFDAFLTEYEIQKCLGFCQEEIDGYSGFVFSTAYGTVYSAPSVNHALARATDAYNAQEKKKAKEEKREPLIIPHFSAHHLRHTFCTRFCENETNLKVIQEIMGHADITTTMDIYAEATKEKKQEVMASLQGKIMVK